MSKKALLRWTIRAWSEMIMATLFLLAVIVLLMLFLTWTALQMFGPRM